MKKSLWKRSVVWLRRIAVVLLAVAMLAGDNLIGGLWSGLTLAGDTGEDTATPAEEVQVVEADPAPEEATSDPESDSGLDPQEAPPAPVAEPDPTEEPEHPEASPVPTQATEPQAEAVAAEDSTLEPEPTEASAPESAAGCIAQAMAEQGYVYVAVGGTELHENARVTGRAVLGTLGDGLALATAYIHGQDGDADALTLRFETEEGPSQGYVRAKDVLCREVDEAAAHRLALIPDREIAHEIILAELVYC